MTYIVIIHQFFREIVRSSYNPFRGQDYIKKWWETADKPDSAETANDDSDAN